MKKNAMRKYGWFVLAISATDQAIKAYVRTRPYGYTFFEVPGMVALTHCFNTGAAFSLLSGRTAFLALISLALLGTICFYACTKMSLTETAYAMLACVLGGGIGNLLDRVCFGGVTDYIRLLFVDFPVFNLADIAITVAIGILMILLITDTLEEASEEKHGSKH